LPFSILLFPFSLFLFPSFASFPARAEQKAIVLDDPSTLPNGINRFEVAPGGSRLYIAGHPKYVVYGSAWKFLESFAVEDGVHTRELQPLPNGWFISCGSYGGGHIGLCRPNGIEAKVLARKGNSHEVLRAGGTGFTSPHGMAVDAEHKLIFAPGISQAVAGKPQPAYSRIAVFDFDGKYVRHINRYDAADPNADDACRTWYDDVEADPARQRVYAAATRTREVLAFTYDGQPGGKAPGLDAVAVFPDGRVAAGSPDRKAILIYDADLKPVQTIPFDYSIRDMEADAQGRLYATVTDPTVGFIRWSADLKTSESLGPRFMKIAVNYPDGVPVAGESVAIKAAIAGRPQPSDTGTWQALLRPSDGADLRWQRLDAKYADGLLAVTLPAAARGPHELAVKFGSGPIDWADRERDLYVQRTITILPTGAARSISVISDTGRTAFRQGEPIAIQLVRRAADPAAAVAVRLMLAGADGALASADLHLQAQLALEMPSSVTRRLVPGRYVLTPTVLNHESYPLSISIAQAEPDSPVQRILYHEFEHGDNPTARRPDFADYAEQMAYVRGRAEAVAALGFSRETDRLAGRLAGQQYPPGWSRENCPGIGSNPGFPPPTMRKT